MRDLPGPVLALIVAGVIMGTMAVATWAFKLDRPERERSEDNVMDAGLALAGLAFSLLAAFVTFFLAGEFREARSGVQAEAVAIESFGFEAARLPPALGGELLAQTSAYVETVIDDEWPLMPKPRLESREAAEALERVFTTFLAPQASMDRSDPRYGLALDGLDRVLQARESRLGAGRGSMSGALWFAVLATATIIGVLAMLYRAGTQRWRKWLQVLATGAVLATIVFVLIMLRTRTRGRSRSPGSRSTRALEVLATLPSGGADSGP